MPPISITTADIAKLLDNLQPYQAAGPDGLSPMVLRELSSVIAPALEKIFSKSLSSHQVPEDWKKTLVTPIFKKGNKDSRAKYRPISLTCIRSKLLEHIITKSIMSHQEHHNLFYHLQHGKIVSDIADNSRANQTDIIILDFSKARLLYNCNIVFTLFSLIHIYIFIVLFL